MRESFIVDTVLNNTFPFSLCRSPSERPGKDCCGQWFAGPPLRAVIAVVALGKLSYYILIPIEAMTRLEIIVFSSVGGVACALGGAALGATGLAGPPTSHLTAALLMIGKLYKIL